ncbi:MAG: hypothetical protein NVS3B3_07910 [Aquirhabdus sp.]
MKKVAPAVEKTASATSIPKPLPKSVKLSYKDQRELDGLPAVIAALEAEQATLEAKLADGSWFMTDSAAATVASNRLATIEQEILDQLERWTTLEAASKGA